MTDIQEKNSFLTAATLPPPENGHTRHKSAGERLFDRIVYTGIGFGVNELSSLWITVQFTKGKNLLAKAPGFLKTVGGWFSGEGFNQASVFFRDLLNLQEKTVIKKGVLRVYS